MRVYQREHTCHFGFFIVVGRFIGGEHSVPGFSVSKNQICKEGSTRDRVKRTGVKRVSEFEGNYKI